MKSRLLKVAKEHFATLLVRGECERLGFEGQTQHSGLVIGFVLDGFESHLPKLMRNLKASLRRLRFHNKSFWPPRHYFYFCVAAELTQVR